MTSAKHMFEGAGKGMRFQQAVDRIRELDASEGMTAFEMGDVVLDQVPMGDDHANNDRDTILTRLASETGVDYEVLRQRRFVSSRVPQGTRVPSVTWAVYREIAQVSDERERGKLLKKVATDVATQYVDGAWRPTPRERWTVDAIRTHIGKPAANPAIGSARLLDRAFKEATPEAIAEVLEQPEIRRRVYEGLQHHEQRVAARTERIAESDPFDRGLDQQRAMLDLRSWVDQMRRQVEQLRDDILPRLGKTPTHDPLAMRQFLAEALADLDDAISPVRTFVETGGTDLDRFLSGVLGGKRG
jgi:hypothetical protein